MSKKIDPHILHKYEIGELIGSGAYGHVWKVQQKSTHQKYALKKVFGAFRNNIDAQRTYREVEILQKIGHPNIIKLHKVLGSANKQDLYLIFELMEADLHAVVGTTILTHNHHKYILFQILKGIAHLHFIKLIHRDLKPSNILLDSNCHVKICDFGLVRSLAVAELEHPILSEEVATKWYRAPELLLGSRTYSYPADLWSIGCIAAQLLIGKPLFEGKSVLEQLQKIIQFTGALSKQDLQSLDSPVVECLVSQIHPKYKTFTDYFSLVNPQFYPLIQGLLKFDPHKRLTAKEALNLQIFQQFLEEANDAQDFQSTAIMPQLDDNHRFNLKDYRKEIYSNIPKQLQAPLDNAQGLRPVKVKSESLKHAPIKKKISKTVDSPAKREPSPFKQRTHSKPSNQKMVQKKRFSHGFLTKQKKQNYLSTPTLSQNHINPYKQQLKLFHSQKDSSNNLIPRLEKKFPHLKKGGKKDKKDYKFKKA